MNIKSLKKLNLDDDFVVTTSSLLEWKNKKIELSADENAISMNQTFSGEFGFISPNNSNLNCGIDACLLFNLSTFKGCDSSERMRELYSNWKKLSEIDCQTEGKIYVVEETKVESSVSTFADSFRPNSSTFHLTEGTVYVIFIVILVILAIIFLVGCIIRFRREHQHPYYVSFV
jgi:hypothetical protein